jgi:hypothetical protein
MFARAGAIPARCNLERMTAICRHRDSARSAEEGVTIRSPPDARGETYKSVQHRPAPFARRHTGLLGFLSR